MADEYKKFDSQDKYEIHHARLSKDATSIPTEKGSMVKVSFASECRSDRYETLWVEATVQDFQADAAAYLKKSDVVGVRGKPGFRTYTDSQGETKYAFELIRAELMIPPSLLKELKERGWVPGQKAEPGKKGGAKKAPAGKKAPPPKKVVEIPEDDEDETSDDEE